MGVNKYESNRRTDVGWEAAVIRTIGDLLDVLAKYPDTSEVYFEFGFMRPTTIASFRGDYSMAALGYDGSSSPRVKRTVRELCTELLCATDGRTFEGWKGGDYTFNHGTELWVDNYGDGSHTRISKVKYDGSVVSLRCKWREYGT
jgi:hypothetical protein